MRNEDVITRDPLNVESSWVGLREPVTPVAECYTRNNYPIPTLHKEDWRLAVRGFGPDRALSFSDLAGLPSFEQEVVLECAGNARTYFDPRPEGTAWRERAVLCARFRGARLADVLDAARVPASAVEILFCGADGPFERSLPRAVALAPDTMVAYEMNGAPLEPRHGAPARLIVPQWYGVASVKWLAEVRALAEPFRGHYQTERYVYAENDPVREKRVNSLIVSPTPDARLVAERPASARGWAWSGRAPIARVEVSLDGGRSWRDAELGAPSPATSWRAWSFAFTPRAGDVAILARATDATGDRQPERALWNKHGYGYNAPRPRRLVAVAQAAP